MSRAVLSVVSCQRITRTWSGKGGVILGGLKVSQQAGAEDASKGDTDLAASWEGTFLPFLFYIYIHHQSVRVFFCWLFSLRSNSFFIFRMYLRAQINTFLPLADPALPRG